MAVGGDQYVEIDPLRTFDYLREEIRQSTVSNHKKVKALKALERLDQEGKLYDDGEVISFDEAFDWEDTEEGYEFWKSIHESPLLIDMEVKC